MCDSIPALARDPIEPIWSEAIVELELLYFDGCPSWQTGLENLKSALELEGIDAAVILVRIQDDADAVRLKFLGSPSFRVNGIELWPEQRETYALSCRVYPSPVGISGWPAIPMLREKLRGIVPSLPQP